MLQVENKETHSNLEIIKCFATVQEKKNQNKLIKIFRKASKAVCCTIKTKVIQNSRLFDKLKLCDSHVKQKLVTMSPYGWYSLCSWDVLF